MERPAPIDPTAQRARLRAFLRWLGPTAAFFGVLEVVAWHVFGDPSSLGAAGVIWLYVGVTMVADRQLGQGALASAAMLVSFGILAAAIVIALIQPFVYPALVVIALVAAATALPYLRGRRLVGSLVACWMGALSIVVLGRLLPVGPVLPPAFLVAFDISAVTAATGLALYLLWQFAADLTDAVDAAHGAMDELRIAEEQRRESERLAAIRERHESLGLIAGSIAHDFNNLLTAVLGHVELLRADAGEGSSDATRESLDAIDAAGRRGAGLARQMLAAAGRAVPVPVSLDPSAFAEGVAQAIRPSLPAGTRLEVEVAEALGPIRADPRQLREAIEHLVANAVEACASDDRGGTSRTIALRVGQRTLPLELPPGSLTPDPLADGTHVDIAVRDDGPGLPAALGARAFEPFVTTGFVGRGLGLPVVLGVARGHGGTVTVDPHDGRGTTVRMLLPRTG